jgi:tetratricopeptide (TPR) repeat protein
VLQRGDTLNVQAELMDVASVAQLWGKQYDRKLADLQVVQDEIAKEISDKLRLKLSVAEQSSVTRRYTEDAEAYQLYLKGRFYWNKRSEVGLLKGIEYFEQAVDRDPTYALAYTGLADCYSLLAVSIDVGSLSPTETMPKAQVAANKAIEIDDTLAEGHTSLAFIRLIHNWDWSGSEAEFKRAIALNPNYANAHHWYSHYFMAMGQIQESLAESKRALELDPLSLILNVHLGWHYLHAQEPDLAIDQFKKTLEMDRSYGLTHWYLGVAYEQKGKYEEAVAELEQAKDLHQGNVLLEADLGHAYAALGRRGDALKVINDLRALSKRKFVSLYHTALIYMGLGDKGPALEWLENADKERSDLVVYLKTDPRLDTLRTDQRFKDLLRRIALPE